MRNKCGVAFQLTCIRDIRYTIVSESKGCKFTNGKLMGLPLNRALRDGSGEAYDVVAGTFLVVGLGEEDFASLSPELAQKYEEHFHQPEDFIQLGHRMMIVRVPDEAVSPEDSKTAPPKDAGHDR